jgi:hypothetical protein
MKLDIQKTKIIAGFVASTSVKMVVATAISTYVPTETKTQKAKVAVGTYVLSGIVASRAKQFAHDEIDDLIESFEAVKNFVNKTPEN